MIFATIGHSFLYETEKLARAFFPFAKFRFSDALPPEEDGISTTVENFTVSARLQINHVKMEETSAFSPDAGEKEQELVVAQTLYRLLCAYSGYEQPWGILTGVRPAKLFSRLWAENGKEATERYFKDTLLVDPQKISLCAVCAESEQSIVKRSGRRAFSLYVSIPFCPSRCAYCSFVSHSVDKAAVLLPQYLQLLAEELRHTAQIVKDLNLQLSTVYIGGGTPSVLSAEQIRELLRVIYTEFDLSSCEEFTFEAGRPETITADKLRALTDYGVSRISINPQTFHDKTLVAIGRRHTVADVYNAFDIASACGIQHINMDLIAGLSGENLSNFEKSIDAAIKLSPQSITVHTLAMKRASELNKNREYDNFAQGETVKQMVDYARQSLTNAYYLPYYMYRQSKTVGNLENVGYAKSGYSGLYNVYIMDETHTILACGASAVTKLRVPEKNLIERTFNFKYPYEYIHRFSEILSRKGQIKAFYEKYKILE
ncbi:MAG: coproporphyrinogen dehydrogenase HemZ [Clostridia bacterium]|nr:coproporphyrinogen dehydrogenase HemZ [Clostridia bacterium]MBQ7289209.1 coproporphyrinogen dehydrogenase HemZ [Clostridia bacterium]